MVDERFRNFERFCSEPALLPLPGESSAAARPD